MHAHVCFVLCRTTSVRFGYGALSIECRVKGNERRCMRMHVCTPEHGIMLLKYYLCMNIEQRKLD